MMVRTVTGQYRSRHSRAAHPPEELCSMAAVHEPANALHKLFAILSAMAPLDQIPANPMHA